MFEFPLTCGWQPILFQSELWCARIVVRPLFSAFLVKTSNILARTKSNKKEPPYPGKRSDKLYIFKQRKKKFAWMWNFARVLISDLKWDWETIRSLKYIASCCAVSRVASWKRLLDFFFYWLNTTLLEEVLFFFALLRNCTWCPELLNKVCNFGNESLQRDHKIR